MAVAAARDCLKGIDRATVGGLYFASTTAPYREKQTAALIAAVLGLPPEAITMDFAGSLRSGTNALKAALDAVASGSRREHPGRGRRYAAGVPGRTRRDELRRRRRCALGQRATTCLAEVKQFDTAYYEIQDTWRSDKDTFVRSAEDRFAMDEGYAQRHERERVRRCSRSTVSRRPISPRWRSTPPTRASSSAIAKKLGFDEKTQVADVLHAGVGDTGCALSSHEPGGGAGAGRSRREDPAGQLRQRLRCRRSGDHRPDRIASTTGEASRRHLASKSADAQLQAVSALARTGAHAAARPPAAGGPHALAGGAVAGSALGDAAHRHQVHEVRHAAVPAPTGLRARATPRTRWSPTTSWTYRRRSFSFSHDYVMQTLDPPVTVTFVDFEGGGRMMCDMTDRDPAAVEVGHAPGDDLPPALLRRTASTTTGGSASR